MQSDGWPWPWQCPFHDTDLRWVRNELVPEIDGVYREIAADFGVEFLSLSDAFDGKENCAEGVTSTEHTRRLDRLEWTVSVGAEDNGRINESAHPNALGQRALGRCLRLVWDSPETGHKCLTNGGVPEDMRLEALR